MADEPAFGDASQPEAGKRRPGLARFQTTKIQQIKTSGNPSGRKRPGEFRALDHLSHRGIINTETEDIQIF
jgi:hypothetical protein